MRSFLKSSFFVLTGQVLSLFIGVLTSSLLSRALGPDLLGNFELLRSTQTIIAAVFSFGIGQASIYYINHEKTPFEKIISNSILIFFISFLFFVLTNIILQTFFSPYFGSLKSGEVLIYLSYGSFLLLNTFFIPIFVAKIETKNIIFSNLLPKTIIFFCVLTIWFAKLSQIKYALLAVLLGYLFGSGFILSRFIKHINIKRNHDFGLIKNLFRYGLRLSMANIIFLFSQNVVLFLIRYFNPENFIELGLFTRALVLSNLVLVIPNTIAPLLYSRWAGLTSFSRLAELKLVMQFSVILSTLASISIIFFAPLIIKVLFGYEFFGSVVYVRIIAPVLIFTTIINVILNFFNSSGDPTKPLMVITVTFLSNFIIGIIFITYFNVLGAAYTLVTTNIIAVILSLIVFQKKYKEPVANLLNFNLLFWNIKKKLFNK